MIVLVSAAIIAVCGGILIHATCSWDRERELADAYRADFEQLYGEDA